MKRPAALKKIEKALKDAKRRIAGAVKAINRDAASAMKKGRYDDAMQAAQHAKEALALRAEIESLERRWRGSGEGVENRANGGRRRDNKKATPRWEYYRPALCALSELGGTANYEQIASRVGQLMRDRLNERDLAETTSGVPRWRNAVRRVKRELAKEGWIEPGGGGAWRLTPSGERAAKVDNSASKASVRSDA